MHHTTEVHGTDHRDNGKGNNLAEKILGHWLCVLYLNIYAMLYVLWNKLMPEAPLSCQIYDL